MLANLVKWNCPPCIKGDTAPIKGAGIAQEEQEARGQSSILDRISLDDVVVKLLTSLDLKTLIMDAIQVKFPDIIRGIVREVVQEERLQHPATSPDDDVIRGLVREVLQEERLKDDPNPGQRSFADVAKQGIPPIDLARLATQVRWEQASHEEREDRLIIKGIKASEDVKDDEGVVREIAAAAGAPLDGIALEIKRIGDLKDGKQLFMVKLPKDQRSSLLKNAKNLKDHGTFSGIFINPDRTKGERHADFLLRSALKEKRKEIPDKSWIISKGKIVEKKA